MTKMTEQKCEDCNKKCATCDVSDEKLVDVRNDYFHFKEAQIGKNTECTLQLNQNSKDIEEMKKGKQECTNKTLPALKQKMNYVLGACAVVSVIFTLIFFTVRTSSGEVEKIKEKQSSLENLVTALDANMKNLIDDVSAINQNQQKFMDNYRENQQKFMADYRESQKEQNELMKKILNEINK